jgi:hypothetical protein
MDKQSATGKDARKKGKEKTGDRENCMTYSILGVAQLLDVDGHSGLRIVLNSHDGGDVMGGGGGGGGGER